MGTLWGRKFEKGPHGDLGHQMGTDLGAVLMEYSAPSLKGQDAGSALRSDQRELPRRRVGQRLLNGQPVRLCVCRGQGHKSCHDCARVQGLFTCLQCMS